MGGLLSVLLFGVFYATVNWRGTPGRDPVSPYIIFVALPGVLVLSIICALVAAFTSTKWWLIVAVISILYGVLWFGTSSV
jgi:ABC-type transport system involved in Fe-S cluster assembly fused permease/ATPase subunit